MKKISSLLKYFQPIDIKNVLKDDDSFNIGESFGYFARMPRKKKLFLNMYSEKELYEIMKRVGLIAHLEMKGYENLLLDIDMDESLIHYFKVYYDEKIPDNLLIDLRLSDSRFVPDKRFFENDELCNLDMVVIEWLSIQNPKGVFSKDKPQLPGQTKPGLGCLKYLIKMMYIVAEGVIKDGFLDVPDHMHGAIMYSKNFKFFNPAHEGVMRAILRDLKKYSLSNLSWGMITNTIIDKSTGKPQVYDPSEQIFPVSSRLKDYFKSKKYLNKFNEVYKRKKYWLDIKTMEKRRTEIIGTKQLDEL